ncbi:MAG: putative Histidine kinase [Candidatus Saccharibacteria bacterium]|nr:putative Histidine kinase [Candidatus Saccharibacteria bacterium]MDB5180609.1 putative Histidine kinase [Candidatus Saccharibacteria bacterium]
MAVINKPQLVKDFFPRFKRGAIFLIIILQVVILLSIAVALQYFGFFNDNPLAFVGTLVAQSVLGVIASLILFRFVAQPIKHLLAAITHIAGEPTSTTPPNPNEEHFAKNGFKPVLQTIYQLAADTPNPLAEGEAQLNKATSTGVIETSSKASIEGALDATICGFVVMNSDRKITYANKATPLRVDQNGVQSLDLLFNENDTIDTWWDECDKNAVRAENTWPRITNKMPNEEDRRYFDVIASYNKGTSSEVVITLIDRTHLYSVGEEELDFIAFAAHELRGPITVIRGYLDVLQDELSEVLQPDQKELFHRLTVSANRLSGYINNILNTSRFDRRHLKMHLAQTTLADVYDTIRDDMQLRASSQARSLAVTIPDGLPNIAADTASLSEVFANLIDNAIKYSNDGGVINVIATSKGDTVEIAIEDFGIGMPGNVVSNLFQKFYRSHRSRESVAGTGIGLYISKAIVESHGGNISVRSEDGKGSTFTVSLPTYQIVADKLKAGNNGNEVLINNEGGWIKNHTMYRG